MYKDAASEIELRVKGALDPKIVHSISARPKDPLELFRKQRRKGYLDPWLDCPDLVGARVIVPEASLKSVVTDTLNAQEGLSVVVEDQTLDADPEVLHYRGLHLHITYKDLTNADGIPIRCEVQVRTIAEHAWSETVHKYVYKSPIDLPADARRVFSRLLVLVELFDEELTKGAGMVSSLESYQCLQLSRHLERKLQDFAAVPSDIGLSVENIVALATAGSGTIESFQQDTDSYIEEHRSELHGIMSAYGPSASGFDIASRWILTQGEALLLLALLDKDEYALSAQLRDSDLYHVVEQLALISGHSGFVIE
ncbi:RelA/SpoT domain-containing protein [Herbiconiux ginsengi]|uniref:PpGpp synthetase catalytic domain-containing protein (RelA/SpoT-type nucleotidyltranferase) n=1 Tax=Herbiconiux ginsengi TaxID=381665 RepID=A0A1H3QT40_9MICO|nr:RelA/SpoT domain-containing protein [Herbiconiux ginsengi]SDZ16175.1 ppGpp synthetase catalytic domain-containing protein (RelA/SpoT-type nucleotidyltranferase) [Herbiconiux ginsengi]